MYGIARFLIFILIVALPLSAHAAPSSVNRLTDHIEPLITTDYIQATYFKATSTSQASTFPFASTTAISATTICFTGNLPCRTSWPSGSSGNVSTSSAETSGRVPFWDSTSATPALLSGGVAGFAWNDSLSRLTATYASTTAFTVSGNTYLTGLTGPSGLAIDANERVYAAATTTYSGGLTYLTGNVTNTLTAGDGLTRTVDDMDCDTASGSVFGCLSSADWTTFNNKQAALTLPLTVPNGGTELATCTNDRLITGNGTSAFVCESGLTYDGSTLLAVTGTTTTSTGFSAATYLEVTSGNGSFNGGRFVLGIVGGNAGQTIGLDANRISIYRKSNNLLAFANVTAGVSVDDGPLSVFATTTSPYFSGNTAGTVAVPVFTFVGDPNTGFWNPGADIMALSTGGSERLRVNVSGNLGIGTTSPFARLSVGGASGGTPFAVATSSAAGTQVFSIDEWGHLISHGTNPTISSCGTSPTITGDDRNMRIQAGSVLATSCTITFAHTYGTAPVCTITQETGTPVAVVASSTPTTLVISGGTFTSDWFVAHCEEYR